VAPAFLFFIKRNFEPNEPQLAPAPPPIGDQADRSQNLKALQIKACRKRPTLTAFFNFRFLLKVKPKKERVIYNTHTPTSIRTLHVMSNF
jgi:hypothetical protein